LIGAQEPDVGPHTFDRPFPPFEFERSRNCLVVEPSLHESRRVTGNDGALGQPRRRQQKTIPVALREGDVVTRLAGSNAEEDRPVDDATGQTTRRDPTIDGLKFIAAAAIVMVHVAQKWPASGLANFVEQVSFSALYFFFLVAGYFHGATGTRGVRWLAGRFARLAVPYAVWSAVLIGFYNLYDLVRRLPPYLPDPVRVIFFAGADEVLWALPWLLACAVLAEMFARTPMTRRLLLLAAAAVQLAVWILVPSSALPQFGVRQFILGGRWVVLYVAGMELRARKSVPGSAFGWVCAAILASAAAGGLALIVGAQPGGRSQYVMFLLNATVAVALLAGSRVGAEWFGVGALSWGGDYLLGIYVSHALWLFILLQLVSATSMPAYVWLPFGWAICFGAAVIVTRLLLSSRWTRRSVI
jgi:fucose 4-O-acetylase-like acetyltransferase